MTQCVFLRHGEPDYTHVTQRGFKGHGRDLAGLTPAGKEQAHRAAMDPRLDGAELILSSPYTRALQTAAIISRVRGLEIGVELDLHEWLPDLTFSFSTAWEAIQASRECHERKGCCPTDHPRPWEDLEHVFQRAYGSLQRYLDRKKIIVVCHGIVMRQFLFQHEIPYGGILEVEVDSQFTWPGFIEDV